MDDFEIEKVKKFINDQTMSDAVYSIIQDVFLRSKGQRDVYVLASERLALNLLSEAWKEIEKYKLNKEDSISSSGQIGL